MRRAESSGRTGINGELEVVGEELVHQTSGLRLHMRGRRRQGSEGVGNGRVLKEEEAVRAWAPRRDSRRIPESRREVRRDVRRRNGGTCAERTRSDNIGIEAPVDRIKG